MDLIRVSSWRFVIVVAVLTPTGALFAQAQSESPKAEDPPKTALPELIQRLAEIERSYLPYELKILETTRFGDDLTAAERARDRRADGRKHQTLLECAQFTRNVWRQKVTSLVDGEISPPGPREDFCDGERLLQVSVRPSIRELGKRTTHVYISTNKRLLSPYLAGPTSGVFCLSGFGEGKPLLEAFNENEKKVDLEWEKGDAKLTFSFGTEMVKRRLVLWLSRDRDWHPIRVQSSFGPRTSTTEWEATKFVRQESVWRAVEGTRRIAGRFEDFKVLEARYGKEVDERQFHHTIPEGAEVRYEGQPEPDTAPVKTRSLLIRVADLADKPIAKATVRIGTSFPRRELHTAQTDAEGLVRTDKAPEGLAVVSVTAPEYRPVVWLGDDAEFRVLMLPCTPGFVIDEKERPVSGVWITNEPVAIRADGLIPVPDRHAKNDDEAWSDEQGRFALKSKLVVGDRETLVSFIAVDGTLENMAILIGPARELIHERKLILQPVCRVRGRCLLEGVAKKLEIPLDVESSQGELLARATVRQELTTAGLQLDVQIRLPPGEYILKGRVSRHAAFAIPVSIPGGKLELDLGTRVIPPGGAMALRGKPAPELQVKWRSGQETTWEKLRGKVVVLDFWGTWCGPCIAAMPELMDVAETYRDQPVAWISVHTPNLKDFEDLDLKLAVLREKTWKNRALTFTTVMDQRFGDERYTGKTSRAFGVAGWPTVFVIDQQGKVVGPVEVKDLAETIRGLIEK